MQYKGLYKSSRGCIPLIIENDFDTLSFEIEGMKFVSSFFEEWSLVNFDSYTKEQLSAFAFYESCFLLQNGETEKTLDLCDCSIEVIIPQILVEKFSGKEIEVNLVGVAELGKVRPKPKSGLDKSQLNLKFEFEGRKLGITDCHSFEDGISRLLTLLENQFYFKNCACCCYSHYNAYGQPYLGGQQCYIKCKEEFLSTVKKYNYNPKADLWHIEGKVDVQEIFCCKNFAKYIKEM